ncbi:MAG: signal peptidase I [Bacteroidetes bacterium]|nr:signal peptidase I [Bacteroidota bacterium]
MKKRSPFISGLFALIEPGLSFTYNGQFKIGISLTLIIWIIQPILVLLGIFKLFFSVIIALLIIILVRIFIIIYSTYYAKHIGLVKLSWYNRWYIYIAFILFPFIANYLLFEMRSTWPQRSFLVSTNSMEPAIIAGDYIIADLTCFDDQNIRVGDVIVFKSPFEPVEYYVKRCVAGGGQKVEIRDGVLYVDDMRSLPTLETSRTSLKILSRDYKDNNMYPKNSGNIDQYGPIIIPYGMFFLLGDRRDNSMDSRYIGFIPKELILGKALYVYWSTEMNRIGHKIQ